MQPKLSPGQSFSFSMLSGCGSEGSMAESEQDLAEEIGFLIAAFCKKQKVSGDDEIGDVKRQLWGQIKERWPDASFTVINRAFSIAYESLLADQHRRGMAVIDALQHHH
jgi:hypothetical protein